MMIHKRKFKKHIDQPRMIELSRLAMTENLHVTDLPYRLSSWALDDPENVCLWDDEQGWLAAWAVMQTPFWMIDYAIRPGLEKESHSAILEWADLRARTMLGTRFGHAAWYISVFTHQVERLEQLEREGFVNDPGGLKQVWMERDISVPLPGTSLPGGFTLRPLAAEAEVRAYVTLHRSVFGTKNMTTAWRRRTLCQTAYNPQTDMVVANSGGKVVAFCIGWLGLSSTGEKIGQIEPLGCVAKLRGLGLARSVLVETIRRLHLLGARCVYVETDIDRDAALGLYTSVGFTIASDVLVYRKDYNDTGI